jgi:potassium efflux system protein
VRELRDRSYTVDELNRAIDRLCRENDIDIAFNQLRSAPPAQREGR